MGRRSSDSVSQSVARRSKARQKVSRASRSSDFAMSSEESISETKLMYVLELLPECSDEVIHAVHKAMEEALKKEEARGDTEPR